jgi:hypothetical protein
VAETEEPLISFEEISSRAQLKTDEFSELLEKVDYAPRETRKLWREIYENAIDDRTHAFVLFADLYRNVSNSSEGHALYGKLMAQYLERMNKANDQLLKLSELVTSAANVDEELDAEALYEEISTTK